MLDILALIIVYVAASYFWVTYVEQYHPNMVDTWYGKILSYPYKLIASFFS